MKFFTRKQKESKKRAEAQSPLLKSKVKPITFLISTILFTVLSSSLVLANSLDTSAITKPIDNFRFVLQEIAPAICIIAWVVGGLMFMFGREARQNGTKVMLFSGMGLVIVKLAESIVGMIGGF